MVSRWLPLGVFFLMVASAFAGVAAAQNETTTPPSSSSSPPPSSSSSSTTSAPPSSSSDPPSSSSGSPPASSSYPPPSYSCPPPPDPCSPPPGGSHPPPPGGQCPPPPNPCSPPPGGNWGHPPQCAPAPGPCGPPGGPGPYGQPIDDPCRAKWEQARAQLEAYHQEYWSKREEFNRRFVEERDAFSREAQNPDDWRQFMEKRNKAADDLVRSYMSELEAKKKSLLGECAGRDGGFGMGPGDLQIPGPPAMNERPMHEQLPRMPHGGSGEFFDKAEALRRECMARAEGVMGPGFRDGPRPGPGARPGPREGGFGGGSGEPLRAPDEPFRPREPRQAPPPDGGFERQPFPDEHRDGPRESGFRDGPQGRPYPGGGPMGGDMDPEKMRKVREIMRECEEKVRDFSEREHPDARGHERNGKPPKDFKERWGSLEMYWDDEKGRIIVQGRYLSLEGEPESQRIENIACRGVKQADSLLVDGILADFSPEESKEGTSLRITDSEKKLVLQLHDTPNCAILMKATREIKSLTLDVADHYECEKKGADLHCKSGKSEAKVLLRDGDVKISVGNVVKVVSGQANFIVKGGARNDREREMEAAIESKDLGAEVKIADEDGDVATDTTTYDGDMDIQVKKEGDNAVSVYVEGDEARTVSFVLDKDLLPGDEVAVQIFAVNEDGAEEPLDAQEASSIADVLAPNEDGDAEVEYRVVVDKKTGETNVLVAFGHFSQKKVQIQSADGSNLLPGFDLGLVVGALGLVALALGVGRRRSA